MKTTILSCFFCLLTFLPAAAQTKPSPESEAFFKKAIAQINPRHVAWIQSTAKSVHAKNMSETEARNMASQYGASQNFNNLDIEALVVLVMMQASNDAQEDLKSMMAGVKSSNEQKKQITDLQRDFAQHKKDVSRPRLDSIQFVLKNPPVVQTVNTGKAMRPVKKVPTNTTSNKQLTRVPQEVTKAEIDKTEQDIKDRLDSVNEMGETESLRLQMAMDRRNKMMTTISNIMKKISDSQSSIIQNMK